MVKGLRVIQSKIEDKLINFYQNLEERDRMKVVFSLPQLRDHSYISVVNRSVHYSGNHIVNQNNGVSFNESIYQSANRSFSPNSSQNKRASNKFSHVRMSSPNKDESSVPKFNTHLDQNGTFSNSLEANQNLIGQMPIQNNRLDSIHKSAIESPENIHRNLVQPNTEFFVPNLGNNLNTNGQTNNLGSHIQFPKAPNVGGNLVLNIPNVGENLVMSSPDVGAKQVMSSPNVGAKQVISIPTVGEKLDIPM